MTAYVARGHAPARLPKNRFDTLCYGRLQACNFAKPQTLTSKVIQWVKAGAK